MARLLIPTMKVATLRVIRNTMLRVLGIFVLLSQTQDPQNNTILPRIVILPRSDLLGHVIATGIMLKR